MKIETFKGKDCPYKPITCQEGYCPDCQIYRNHSQGAMGQHKKLCPVCKADLKVWVATGLGEHKHYQIKEVTNG